MAEEGTPPADSQPVEDDGGGLIDGAVDAVIPDIDLPEIPGIGDLATGITDGLLEGFFTTLGEALVSAATKVNELVFALLTSTTSVDLNSLRGGGLLAMTTSIGVAMVLAFFFASIVRGLVRGEYSAITRAALVDVPLALVGTIGLVTFTQLLLSITDAATGALLDNAAADLGESSIGVLSSPEAVISGGLLSGLIMIVYIIAALLTWLWLFLRAALIYFIIVAAPLGLATRAFPPAAVFARRTIEMAIALIVSKFFLAIALSLGASQFNAAATGDADLSTMLIGAGTMVLAAFMPSVVLKLIPIAEGATATAGAERAPLRMAAAAGELPWRWEQRALRLRRRPLREMAVARLAGRREEGPAALVLVAATAALKALGAPRHRDPRLPRTRAPTAESLMVARVVLVAPEDRGRQVRPGHRERTEATECPSLRSAAAVSASSRDLHPAPEARPARSATYERRHQPAIGTSSVDRSATAQRTKDGGVVVTTVAQEPKRRYRLSPQDETGLMFGRTMAQLFIAAAGVVIGATLLLTAGFLPGLLVGGGLVGFGMTSIDGKPLIEWVGHGTNYVRFKKQATSEWFSIVPLLGGTEEIEAPGPLVDHDLLVADAGVFGVGPAGQKIAVSRDRRGKILAATIKVTGRQFSLLEEDEQDRLIGQWGTALQAFIADRTAVASIWWS